MKKITFLLILLALGTFTVDVIAQKSKDTPVTSIIQDIDVNGLPYRIQSDSQGDYKNGVNSVVSIVQGIGNWELDMLSSANRRIFVDFAEPVPNTNPSNLPPPFSVGYVTSRFISKCVTNITEGCAN